MDGGKEEEWMSRWAVERMDLLLEKKRKAGREDRQVEFGEKIQLLCWGEAEGWGMAALTRELGAVSLKYAERAGSEKGADRQGRFRTVVAIPLC